MRTQSWSVALVGAANLLAFSIGPAVADERAESIFKEARNYTVRIRTQITTPFMEDDQGSFSGAGFLVDAGRRWVLTNAHVVGQSPSEVQVAFVDGTFRPARKVYVDSFTDMAVLEVVADGATHQVAPVNCDHVPDVGEGVGAFGHPLGMLFTGTRGIVSGKTSQFVNDLVQIDATVDHGNSGGPVISLRDGRVIGIATAGAGGDKSDRLNFATPMKDVCRVLDLLRRGTLPDPPQMEFSLLVDEEGRHTLQVGRTYDSDRWPFQPGDRIISVGAEGEQVRSLSNLVTALRGRAGTVPIRLERAGREMMIKATPSYRPAVIARRGVSLDGALIARIAFEDSSALTDSPTLFVQSVESGSAAEAHGLEKSDIVQTIDGRRFENLQSLITYLDRREAGTPIHIVVRRWSRSIDRWFEYQARELPGEDTKVVGPETKLLSNGP